MRYGGILEESKWDMYLKTPQNYMPATLLFKTGTSADQLITSLKEAAINFPLIVKPDRGMRGKGIEIIHSPQELQLWKPKPGFDFIFQPFLDYPKEIGAFLIRNPETGKWKVSSLMEREFLHVTGDGQSNLELLIRKNERAFLQLKRWKQNKTYPLQKVVEEDRVFKLGSIGNHRLGTCFKDASHHLDDTLSESLIKIAQSLPGFEYGRMDIRFCNWEGLKAGKDRVLIEVNGANSEPAHIYDPQYSLFYAWKVLIHHFKVQHQLARKRIENGEKPVSVQQALSLFRQYNHTMKDLD